MLLFFELSFYSSAKAAKLVILKIIVLLILREKERRRHLNMVTFTGKNHKQRTLYSRVCEDTNLLSRVVNITHE